ncbi:hypothetical protein VTN96DRAFT_6398 [Rasamsonia emersonii]|uniref:Thioesterase domain protein n=1 Tax=Rasamsonia emersonii (strain ATCC 16479 / CBS 393.64 / IMI 116815) TaxID=1408163 RepID=A0A0F4Z0C6_RASE3|nr:Thioesterase domain protein [Rasamsonia emersonii CBS 393.64]KKA23959.1 Thioesterase domain protein [Rasamsonia emersonii CBS 393.64]
MAATAEAANNNNINININNPHLYEGERLETIAGYPTLFKFLPARDHSASNNKNRPPLMVFIPGASHLARIAYGGHKGYDPRNFLAYWLNAAGYDVLAISYPLETTIMAPHHPDFRVPAWGQQAAMTTRKVVDENALSGEVVLLGWSMGGKILKPFMASARECGLRVKLFVALAATPGGITGLRAYPAGIRRTAAGYATCAGFAEAFLRQIHEQQRQEGENAPAIIDDDVFLREYFGHTPVRLTSWGLTYPDSSNGKNNNNNNIDDSGFIPDEWEALRDAGPTDQDIRGYPFIGSIRPTSMLDTRHTLCDSANWGMNLTLKLTADVTKALSSSHRSSSSSSQDEKEHWWNKLTDLVYSAPAQMTTETVKGTHFFFLGKTGARATAEAIVRLIEKMERIQREMVELLAKLS